MLRGIDVSGNNGTIVWGQVKTAGIRFAFTKASEGLTWVDPHFERNVAGARKVGIPIGAYHYGRPDRHPHDPGGEARHFAQQLAKVDVGELRPVLDLEVADGIGPGALLGWAEAFLEELERRVGVKAILYTYADFLVRHLDLAHGLGRYGVWLAAYGANDGHLHTIPKLGGPPVLIHQFTSRGHVDGIHGDVDLNDAAALEQLLAKPRRPGSDPGHERPLPGPARKPRWFWPALREFLRRRHRKAGRR